MARSDDKIGALWQRSSRGGVEFLSGEIEIGGQKQRITVFRNGYRTDVNRQPHFIIYRDNGQVTPATEPAPAVPEDQMEPSPFRAGDEG